MFEVKQPNPEANKKIAVIGNWNFHNQYFGKSQRWPLITFLKILKRFVYVVVDNEHHTTKRCSNCVWGKKALWKHPEFGFVADSAATNGVRAVMARRNHSRVASDQGSSRGQQDSLIPDYYPTLDDLSQQNLPGATTRQGSNAAKHDTKLCGSCNRRINRDANGAVNILNHFIWKVSRFIHADQKQRKQLSKEWNKPEARHPAFFYLSSRNLKDWLATHQEFNQSS